MKKDIHPTLNPVVFIDTTEGTEFVTTSTLTSEETKKINGVDHFVIKVELSSASHPFYTGKQKLVDTAGRVEKFKARMEKAQKASGSKGDDDDSSDDTAADEKAEELITEEPAKEETPVEEVETEVAEEESTEEVEEPAAEEVEAAEESEEEKAE